MQIGLVGIFGFIVVVSSTGAFYDPRGSYWITTACPPSTSGNGGEVREGSSGARSCKDESTEQALGPAGAAGCGYRQ